MLIKIKVKKQSRYFEFDDTLKNSMMIEKELIQTKFKLKINSKKKQMKHVV